MGVNGAAGEDCPGCYWVGEPGDSRIPLPPAERATSPPAAKVKSSTRWLSPRSGPVRCGSPRKAGHTVGRRQAGSDSWGLRTWGRGSFPVSNSIAPSPVEVPAATHAASGGSGCAPWSPGRAGCRDWSLRGLLPVRGGNACKVEKRMVEMAGPEF